MEGEFINKKKYALLYGFRIIVVLFEDPLSVSISYITALLVSSTRVVFKGGLRVKKSFMAVPASCSLNSDNTDTGDWWFNGYQTHHPRWKLNLYATPGSVRWAARYHNIAIA